MNNQNQGLGCLGCLGIIVTLFFIVVFIGGCMAVFSDSGNETEDTEQNEQVEQVEETNDNEQNEFEEQNNQDTEEENVGEPVEEPVEENVGEPVEEPEEPVEEIEEESSEQPIEHQESETQNENQNQRGTSVALDRVVDGDTVHVYLNGESIGLRLLLIDTPETVHPQKPVEPYGPEASDRVKQILNNANSITIEYDDGDKTDHYDRHLVYIYADGTSVQETLLEEGLARVGYIYEQQRYLNEYRNAESIAKQNNLGIWSIPGYVNESGEGFNSGDKESESTTSSSESGESSGTTANGGKKYKNCEELRKDFPDGVSSDHPSYDPARDGDKDGWACD